VIKFIEYFFDENGIGIPELKFWVGISKHRFFLNIDYRIWVDILYWYIE